MLIHRIRRNGAPGASEDVPEGGRRVSPEPPGPAEDLEQQWLVDIAGQWKKGYVISAYVSNKAITVSGDLKVTAP